MSKISQLVAALMCVDETYHYVFNGGSMCAIEVVIKVQLLFNAWNESLKFIGGALKLSKCYWTL